MIVRLGREYYSAGKSLKRKHSVEFAAEQEFYGCTYTATAVVCHQGNSLVSGHYNGYVSAYASGLRKWYRMDDSPPTCEEVAWLTAAATPVQRGVYMVWYALKPL